MLNIVVPMAGAGSRFASAGFVLPKPLIPINGVPMIRLVIKNLTPAQEHRFIFVAQQGHVARYGLDNLLPQWAPGCAVVAIDGVTDGAARTVLAARDYIDTSEPLMIANSDQYIDSDINGYLADWEQDAGLIMTMTAHDPKWSYVRLSDGVVTEVIEKVVVSDHATVGIYNFAAGSDFVSAADSMIAAQRMSNGEYYVAPAYNELIAEGYRVTTSNIGTEAGGMYGLGIPSDLDLFVRHPVSTRALKGLT